MAYKCIADSDSVIRLADGHSIPADPTNTDYQAFLLWQQEGNQLLPADPAPVPVRDVDTVAPATRDDLLSFAAMTPVELEVWVEKNVVDLPSAIGAIKNLAVAMSIIYRR